MRQLAGQTKPARNDFSLFAREYFQRCKERFGDIETLTAKWTLEDLIPGLSDLDSRIVVSNSVGPAQMIELDEVVGKVHADLCREHPHWSRILEHTPGVAVTWNELREPALYNTETRAWSGYFGNPDRFAQLETDLASIPWQEEDELYYLRKFAYYFSPYQRGIDPAINLGIFEPEYAWHSRAMHYFTPAVQAAAGVVTKSTVRGKLESLRIWEKILPDEGVFGRVRDMASRQYAMEDLTDDGALRKFEDELFAALRKVKAVLFESAEIIPLIADDDISKLRAGLKEFQGNPLMAIFYGVRFSRIRKSRYAFYLNAPEYFDTDWLLKNEFVKWNRDVLMQAILRAYGKLKCEKSDANFEEIIEAICPDVIDPGEADLMRKMREISFDRYEPGKERELTQEIIPLWADYYVILERILQDARKITARANSAARRRP